MAARGRDKRRSSITPEAAGRITTVLLGLFTAYLAVGAVGLVIYLQLSEFFLPLAPVQRGPLYQAMIAFGLAMAVSATAFLVARRKSRVSPRVPKITVSILFLAWIVSADLLVGIIFPRPRPPSMHTMFLVHPARGWTHRPSGQATFYRTLIRLDKDGLRVDEKDGGEDMTGKKRILFVGDSLTLGYYQKARDAFGYQTVERLKQRYPEVGMIALNGGTCGYDMRQTAHWLAHDGLKLEPDLVVLQFCLNDVTAQYDPEFGANQNRHLELTHCFEATSVSGFHRALIALSRRLEWGDDLQAAAEEIEHFDIEQLFLQDPPDKVERAWRSMFEQMRTAIDRCREAGVPVVLVSFPFRGQMAKPELPPWPQERLARFTAEQSVPYLRMLPTYRREAGGDTAAAAATKLFVDVTHPTKLGHQLAADALVEFLLDSGLLDPIVARPTESP